MSRRAPRYIANFDSASAMLRGLARYLHGKDFPGLGIAPSALEPLGKLINRLPQAIREQIYIWSGWSDAISSRRLSGVDAEAVTAWMIGCYPRRRYPAVAIGSSSGALVHLCAALGIPWLPQTFLIPVARHGVHPDEPKDDLCWGYEPGWRLINANPQLQLHHMNDANQDRLMIRRMTYFRVKRLWLGEVYEQFLNDVLAPGGTIFLSECNLKWPTVKVRDRHYFQHGALGGATPQEFLGGSQRVEEYLWRYGSHRRRWDSPRPDAERPEAEWGFEPALRDDVERFAQKKGHRVVRIAFDEPEHLSPLVADLYRRWYRQRRIVANRLLVESFLLSEPYWCLRTGACPFWLTFNKQPSADTLEEYLEFAEPFDEIYMMLFSHGVDSVGLVPIERWRSILQRARRRGEFVGVDERSYPRDFATFVRYHTDLKGKIPARYPLPGYLTLHQLEEFLEDEAHHYKVEWLEDGKRFGPVEGTPTVPRVTASG